jgi:hypothetical protein
MISEYIALTLPPLNNDDFLKLFLSELSCLSFGYLERIFLILLVLLLDRVERVYFHGLVMLL